MNHFFSTLILAFSLLSPFQNEEAIRSNILNKFENCQKSEGYTTIWKMVMAPDKFHGYTLHYFGNKKFTQDAARIHLVTNIEWLLSSFNNEKKLEKNLYRHPLQPEDFTLSYIFFESEGQVSKIPYVSAVSNHHDVIEYRLSKNNEIEDDEIIIEPYDVAYEKVYGHKRL